MTQPALVEELSFHLNGPLFQFGENGYNVELAAFDQAIGHRPELIVGATGPADIIAAVRFAAQNGLPVAVLGAGHQASVPADGAVLINTRRMAGVRVDTVTATARVEAGARSGSVVHEAAVFGLAPLNGSAPTVCIIPYILGGGIALLGRLYGWAADHVRQFDLVTADGQLRQVSPDLEPDLFWAVRGGKGNFGVVTSMEIDLMPIARLYGGGLYFDADAAADVLHTYLEWTATMPDEMGSSVLMAKFPPIPQIPEPLQGRFVVHIRIEYAGPASEGQRLVQPLRDVAPRIIDTVQDMPYSAVSTIHNDPTGPTAAYGRTSFLGDLDSAAVDTLLTVAGPDSGQSYIVELRCLGGAFSRPPAIPNAIGRRDALFSLFSSSVIEPELLDAIRTSHDQLHQSLQPWSTGALPLNFAGVADAAPQRVRLGYTAADYDRLVQIKDRYDPNNMFRINHNIPPSTTT